MTKNRKTAFALTLAGVMMLGTACGSGNGAEGGSNSEKGDAKGKDVSISFIHWRGEDAKVFNTLIEKFEQENPGIKVKMDIYPSEQYQSTAQAKLLDGTTGDVFAAMPGAQFEAIAKAGLFTDLTNEPFVGNFSQNLIQVGVKDGDSVKSLWV